jgi:mono/diheme cytochrome c family protein
MAVALVEGQGGQRGGGGGQAAGTAAGAAILQRSCGSCHGADVIASYHYDTPDSYRDVVNSMIASGAQVSAQELPVLVDYLFATYGKKQEGARGGAAPATASDPGKSILETACTTCHGLDPLANHVYESKEPYESLIRNMIAYGANVTDAQIGPLSEYMLKTYGKKPAAVAPANGSAGAGTAAAADPGKAILESACTACHGLDGLANHKYESKAPYEGLVRSMIAYGANVTDAQVGPLVDYMFKTYGKK